MMRSDWTSAGNEQCRRMLLSMGARWTAGTMEAPSLGAL
jgi:hypothetical protein